MIAFLLQHYIHYINLGNISLQLASERHHEGTQRLLPLSRMTCPNNHMLERKYISGGEETLCDICNTLISRGSFIASCISCDYDVCNNISCYNLVKQFTAIRSPCIVFSAHGDTCFGESTCQYVEGSNNTLYYGHMDNAAGVHALMQAYFSGQLPPKQVQCQVTYGEEGNINGVDFAGAREIMNSLQENDFVAVIDVTGTCSRRVNKQTVCDDSSNIGHVVLEKVKCSAFILSLLSQISGLLTKIDGVLPEEYLKSVDGEVRSLQGYGGYGEEYTSAIRRLVATRYSPSAPSTSSDGLLPFRIAGTTTSGDMQSYPYTFEIWNECDDPQACEDETDAYREQVNHTVFLGLQTCGGRWEVPTSLSATGQGRSSGDGRGRGGGEGRVYVSNGDYNEGPVFCWKKDIDAVTSIVIDLAKAFVANNR